MKQLNSIKLTKKQQEFFNNHLPYLATVDKNGEPQIGPKASLKVLDDSHLQYLEKTQAQAYNNLKNGSKAAIVVADVPTHKAIKIIATPHIHENDDYAKSIVEGTDTPNAYVVVLDIEKIFE